MKIPRTTIWTAVGLCGLAAIAAAPVAADQVILDDLIVDGSICAGFDCVNGESFGFDTIRMKENNLRINAVDTSTSASFPTQDWQLTFNETSNGGLNKFSIDCTNPGGKTPFTIEGCAPSHSLYVEDGGNVGLGTNTPVVELHIKDGDTPTLRLEQDGTSGFTPQIFDVAANETNFFVRDVTQGSKLPFRLRPGAPTSSIDVAADGDVGMGTTSPAFELHIRRTDASNTFAQIENAAGSAQLTGLSLVNNTASYVFQINSLGDFQISQGGTGDAEFTIDNGAVGSQGKFVFRDGNTLTLMTIEADGDVTNATGSFVMSSDRNAKTDITRVDPRDVLAKVSAMPISTWRYKENSDKLHLGPMAQDFWAAFGLHEGPKAISLSDLSGVALAAVQGLEQEIQERDVVIQQLTERLEALEARLAE